VKRRHCLLAGLGSSVVAALARAQTARRARVALLSATGPESDGQRHPVHQVFVQHLGTLGWTEGVNLQVEIRYGHANPERIAAAAGELVALAPDLIVASGTPTVRALARATQRIPIVMAGAGDPVGTGLAASLARPGGNVTGVSMMGQEIIPKALSLLHELLPKARRIDLLGGATNPSNPFFEKVWVDALRALGLEGEMVVVRGADDIEAVIAASRADALLALADPLFVAHGHAERLMNAAIRRRLPLVDVAGRRYIAAGSLMSYAVDFPEMFRQAAVYADRILRGAKPAETPIEQPLRCCAPTR
jgi:putative tryptophan/tyrosine transport system substrate-binding protein